MNPKDALNDMRTIKQLLTDAERIARELGEREPAAEHLLLSAMGLPDGTATRALGRVGVDADAIRTALVAEQADALATAGLPRDRAEALAAPAPLGDAGTPLLYGAGPTARDAFRAAGDAARRSKQRIRGAHVVAAIADTDRGTIARVLDRLGVDRDQLRAAAAEELRAAT
jgi:ATP-dependent Clp protease ATP-binding subunit ClpA